MTSSVARKIVLACLVASMIPAVAFGRGAATGGELILCSASGVRVATGTFTFTFVTLASQGGTTTLNVPVGTCTGRLFYPVGASVTVTENLPSSYAVTGIAIGPTPGGVGTTSVISSNTPTTASAVVTIGTGQATLTFTTNGPAGAARLCKVPNLFGVTLAAAKSALRKANCTVGAVHKAYSNIYYPQVVYSQSPPRGSVLAPRAQVSLTVSLGHRP
jgi:acetaldehyde dehydrogenase (acetylating)